MEKILVSACFLGQKVRYDGGHQQLVSQQFVRWQQQQRLVALCPEVAGGLSVPRAPAEINQNNQRVYDINGGDVSEPFLQGAQTALALCQQNNIHFALLKEFSPSCGAQWVYDGSFSGKKISGQGITAALLIQHGIKVYSEQTLDELVKQIALVDKD